MVDKRQYKQRLEVGTPQNNSSHEQKQPLYTCILYFGAFLCRPLQNNNVKYEQIHRARFCRERERKRFALTKG